ncbi:hypothetical protein DUI87_11365 [Hirundo rustica rustica]|uniref:Uncharacterized protein n=1 Tax=Hirundo rustica rustica TaxID=333673 RepID=A0A3M0KVW4_HIRRU|nr:hypothetical protein DUI87_11365 [Hirundo rustica rustica]
MNLNPNCRLQITVQEYREVMSICKQSLDVLSEDIVQLSLSIPGTAVENPAQHILKIEEVEVEMKDWWCTTGLQAGDKGTALGCKSCGYSENGMLARLPITVEDMDILKVTVYPQLL